VALPPPRWDYSGDGGPERWSTLQPENAICASGLRQSPIDIRDGIKVQLDPVQFDYQPSGFRVVDTGYTVQVNVAAGNTIQIMGRRYELVGFNFRRPSEERVNGRGFDMGVHMVHKDMDGRLAVVAVMLTRGAAQPVIQSVWNNLPLERNREVEAASLIDPYKLLPDDPRYITYMGSLTTPPCTEGVLWIVMKTPVQVSAEQIAIFSRLYPMNARPVQPDNGRLIKESN
jgi:carbonic anhydrase